MFLMNQCWLWNASGGLFNHVHIWVRPNQPWICLFLGQTEGWFGSKLCVWVKIVCVIPIPGFICKPFSWTNFDFRVLRKQPVIICKCDWGFLHMWFGPVQLWNCWFLANTGGYLGRKYCGRLKMPYMVTIRGFINLAHEPILTLEWFCSRLQSCVHVLWAKIASKLLVFDHIWGLAWQ